MKTNSVVEFRILVRRFAFVLYTFSDQKPTGDIRVRDGFGGVRPQFSPIRRRQRSFGERFHSPLSHVELTKRTVLRNRNNFERNRRPYYLRRPVFEATRPARSFIYHARRVPVLKVPSPAGGLYSAS